MTNYIPLNSSTHKNTKITPPKSLTHTRSMHLAPLSVQEFANACHDYPIVFVKDSETGQFRATALLGIKPEQNLFYDEQRWKADYIPESLRLYPFIMSINPNDPEQGMLCVDSESDLLNEYEGQALFNEDGTQSDFTKATGEFVANYNAKQHSTLAFAKTLVEKSLLVTKNLELKLPNQESYNLTGLYIVDEEKLKSLSSEDFLYLREKGMLVPIYAQLFSLSRIQKLINLSAN